MRLAAGQAIYNKISGKINKTTVKEHLRKVNVVSDEELGRLCDEFYVTLISNVMAVFGVAVVLCVLLAVKSMTSGDEVTISRDTYGGSETTVALETEVDGEIESFDATVLPLVYSEDTIDEAFEAGFEYIDEVYLGENETADEIVADLNFVTYIDDLGLTVEWQTDETEYISYEGEVISGTLEEPVTVGIVVKLSYESYSAEEEFYVVVYGKEKSKTALVIEMLQQQIEDLQLAAGDENEITLPTEIDGYSVSASTSKGTVAVFFFMGVFVCVLIGFKAFSDLQEKEKERDKELLAAYPSFVDMLSLYMGAGLTVKGTMIRIASATKNDVLSEEISYALNEVQAGLPETEGYYRLGFRLGLPVYLKIMTLLSQNVRKGTRDILHMLEEEEVAALQLKRELAKKKGEEAGTKLLFPMILQLGTVMVIVVLPAMMSF